jgi:hypothetical protein
MGEKRDDLHFRRKIERSGLPLDTLDFSLESLRPRLILHHFLSFLAFGMLFNHPLRGCRWNVRGFLQRALPKPI